MNIQIANYMHIRQISHLYEQFFTYNANQLPDYYKTASENGEYPKSIIESCTAELFVAIDHEILIGILHICEESTPPFPCYVPYKFATVIDLFITPDYRNLGIGALLLAEAEKWARNRKLSYIELSVLKNNIEGERFYKREGFKEVTRTMRYTL